MHDPVSLSDPGGAGTTPLGDRRSTWRPLTRSWQYALPVLILFAFLIWNHRWLHEDGLINLRVVVNLLNGDGPVYNVGERVEAFTSPAQILVLTLGSIISFGRLPIEQVVFATGLICAAAGLFAGIRGAMQLWSEADEGTLPIGALIFVAIPFTWDFATSGHEGAVSFLWLGVAFQVLAERRRILSAGRDIDVAAPAWKLMWLGAGPFVRPEFALFSMAFAVAWLWLHRDRLAGWWRALLWMGTVSGGYQLFRMGYYGMLVPNTALAKLGGPQGSSHGLTYIGHFVRPIALWFPLLIVAIGLAITLRSRGGGDRTVVVLAMMIPATLQVGYLISIGGDYINGRLLVAPLFALLAPAFVLPVQTFRTASGRVSTSSVVGAMAVLLWAGICMTSLRAPWDADSSNYLSSKWDARSLAVNKWVRDEARTIEAYRQSFLAGPANDLVRNDVASGGDVLVIDDPYQPQVIQLPPGSGRMVASTTVGALGVVVGPDVRIIDRLSLADMIGSRLPPTGTTAGHLRKLPIPWVWARAGHPADRDSTTAARAMTCGDLRDLMEATTEPMSVSRFVSNVLNAPRLTSVEVPLDPEAAVVRFC